MKAINDKFPLVECPILLENFNSYNCHLKQLSVLLEKYQTSSFLIGKNIRFIQNYLLSFIHQHIFGLLTTLKSMFRNYFFLIWFFPSDSFDGNKNDYRLRMIKLDNQIRLFQNYQIYPFRQGVNWQFPTSKIFIIKNVFDATSSMET